MMMQVDSIYNPLKLTLSTLDFVDIKYSMDMSDLEIVAEVTDMIQRSPTEIVAYEMGWDRLDKMLNQITVRLYFKNKIDYSLLN